MPTFLENRSVRRRALKAAREDLKPLIRNRAEQMLQELRQSQTEALAVRQAILATNKKKAAETVEVSSL